MKISLTCVSSFFLGDLGLESEFDLVRNLFINCSTGVEGPDLCLALSPLASSICPSKICPIGDIGSAGPLGANIVGVTPCAWSCDSSIERSMTIAGFFPGFFIPDTSDLERGRKLSKKFFTFEDVVGEPLLLSSPDLFRCRVFPLSRLFRPVDPARGRKSWSTSIIFPSATSESRRGIAKALRSWNTQGSCYLESVMHGGRDPPLSTRYTSYNRMDGPDNRNWRNDYTGTICFFRNYIITYKIESGKLYIDKTILTETVWLSNKSKCSQNIF